MHGCIKDDSHKQEVRLNVTAECQRKELQQQTVLEKGFEDNSSQNSKQKRMLAPDAHAAVSCIFKYRVNKQMWTQLAIELQLALLLVLH